MQYFYVERSAEDNNTESVTERMRNAAYACLESCSTFASTESGRKLLAFAIVGTALVGASLIFGTAFETANTVWLVNRSDNTVYPKWISPIGVKDKCGPVILPGTYCSYKFNGINSYMDIETSNSGTLHINTKCQTSLKNGPKDQKLTSHGITFWTCYTQYEDQAVSEDTTPHLRGASTSV